MDEIAEREARAEAAKMTRAFLGFAGVLGVCFVILLAVMAWKLSHGRPQIPASSPAVAAASADKDAQIAQLRLQIAALQGQAAGGGASSSAATPDAPTQGATSTANPTATGAYYGGTSVASLSARMDRLEASQKALARAASAAYAARTLQLAAHDGDPFLSELAMAEPTIDDPGLAAALRPYAEKGVPSEVTLAVRFPAAAAKANIAAETHNGKSGFFDQIAHGLSHFISVRRTDNLNGQGTEAILARAESRLNLGDLHGAVGYLTALPPAAHTAMKPWLDEAQARLLVDDTTRRISEKAMSRLSQSANDPAYGVTPEGGLL
jgi:hypothetical protein